MNKSETPRWKRRKLGGTISGPIKQLMENKKLNSIVFHEKNEKLAVNTRAAACMYIWRNKLDLHTKIIADSVYILKDKDYIGDCEEYDMM